MVNDDYFAFTDVYGFKFSRCRRDESASDCTAVSPAVAAVLLYIYLLRVTRCINVSHLMHNNKIYKFYHNIRLVVLSCGSQHILFRRGGDERTAPGFFFSSREFYSD